MRESMDSVSVEVSVPVLLGRLKAKSRLVPLLPTRFDYDDDPAEAFALNSEKKT